MDRDFLKKLWDKVEAKLGAFAAIVPMIVAQIKIAIKAGDADEIRSRGYELIEAGESMTNLGHKMVEATEKDPDGVVRLTVDESTGVLAALAELVDEAEDVVTGKDEDDTQP